ncbi:dynamin family protein [Romboutsia sp.]|uniref:dynamin family protein n=1 Tax=Romboutsia sp. TaxID=1965302 RepID=UPI003F331371
MKDINKEKLYLQDIVKNSYDSIKKELPNSYELKSMKELMADIENDFYTVVVVGEFKRGKSTFINAILGDDILPVDVTPTTATINAVMWNEEKKLHVHKTDGNVEELELNYENLNKYVASRKFDHSSINYLKIGMPADILKNNVVLIDTPGVDDLNKQRVDVTYNIIPRADAVIFLLDSTNAVRRTEKEFLENNILKEGINKVLFVANFIDEIDEDEDVEEVIEDISTRLSNILKMGPVQVLPVSAREALEGILDKDEERIENSGITQVSNVVKEAIDKGVESDERIQRYKARTVGILNSVKREINTLFQLENKTIDQLNIELENINKLIDNKSKLKPEINRYVLRQEEEMLAIVNKSIYYFIDELKSEIYYQFDAYKGADFKDFIEIHMPKMVERQIKNWIRQYLGQINSMFKMIEKELSNGMAKHFNTSVVKFNTNYLGEGVNPSNIANISIEAEDISKIGAVAGVLAGGSAIVVSLLGGGILLPLIGMAGAPFIGNKLKEKKLEEAKLKVRPDLESAIDDIAYKLIRTMDEYVLKNTSQIRISCENRYDAILLSIKQKVEKEIQEKENLKTKIKNKNEHLKKILLSIEEYTILMEGDNECI